MLLNLLAQWGMRTGSMSRVIVDDALKRHAHELAEKQRKAMWDKRAFEMAAHGAIDHETELEVGAVLRAAHLIDPLPQRKDGQS